MWPSQTNESQSQDFGRNYLEIDDFSAVVAQRVGCTPGTAEAILKGHGGFLPGKKPSQRIAETRDGQRHIPNMSQAPGSIHSRILQVRVEFPSFAFRGVPAHSGSCVYPSHLSSFQSFPLWPTRNADICLKSINRLTSSSAHRHLSKLIHLQERNGERREGNRIF